MKSAVLSKIVTVILILLGIPSFAQQGFEIGVAYMIQKTMLNNKSDKGLEGRLNKIGTFSYLNGGLTALYHFNNTWSVEADLFRTRQGQIYAGTNPAAGLNQSYTRIITLQAVFNDESIHGNYRAKTELNGLKIPLMLRWNSCTNRPLSFHVAAGPQLNIITNVDYELNHQDVELPNSRMKPNDAYKHVTVDGVIAPGVSYKLSKHLYANADLRVDYGFADVENKEAEFTYIRLTDKYYGQSRAETHNVTIGAMVALSYRL